MTAAATRRHWTDKELLAMPDDGWKRQIVGGELISMSPAGFEHGTILARIIAAVGMNVYKHEWGELADGQTGYRVPNGDLFSPDISFVTTARVEAQRRRKTAFFQGAPDFFVEVLSPSDTVEVLEEELDQFFAQGARLAWVVHPRRHCVYVYHAADDFRVLQSKDALDGEDVLPGFKLRLRRIFR